MEAWYQFRTLWWLVVLTSVSGVQVWLPWSEWSPCSRSCGEGVQTRVRTCEKGEEDHSSAWPRKCLGDTEQFRTCVISKCPGNPDVRALQCSEYGTKLQVTKFAAGEWKSLNNGLNPCELRCFHPSSGLIKSLGKVLDGASCVAGLSNVCLNGRCVGVGCDGVINSRSQTNKCGQCGPDSGFSCVRVRRSFHQAQGSAESKRYERVEVFPKFSRHLEIRDGSSHNIPVLEDGSQRVWVHKDQRIPMQYRLAGSVITFKPLDKGFQLSSPGPLMQNLSFWVLIQDKHPNITYEYWTTEGKQRPKEVEDNAVPTASNYWRYNGSSEDIFKETVSVLPASPPPPFRPPSRRPHDRKRGKKKGKKCKECKGSKNMKKHFCQSEQVLRLRVRQVSRGKDGSTSYQVDVIAAMRRPPAEKQPRRVQVLWSRCCPRLRVGREYFVGVSRREDGSLELGPLQVRVTPRKEAVAIRRAQRCPP